MSATFSINIGQLTEATRKTDIFSVLNDIQDNTQKLISPRDVRDAVLSTWANTPFKVTTPNSLSNYEYIGIDSSNPGNRDIKQKILLGKRIRQLREEKSISQTELGYLCNIERSNMNRIEVGNTCPNVFTLYKIANNLGVSLSTIFEFKE